MKGMTAYPRTNLLHALVVLSLLFTGCVDPGEQKPAPARPKRVDDPLIGSWKVIDAKGSYAKGNIGIVWTFEEGGTAKSAGLADPPGTGRHDGPVGANAVQTESLWEWERISNDKIEMAPKDAAGAAEIRHSFEGNKLVLYWNNGGQVLYLVKQ